MNRVAWIDGAKRTLMPAQLVGQGGEAEIYDLGDGRVVKWWKPPAHPDFDGLPEAQAAAARRIAEAPAKLRAIPGKLPAAVVVPSGFAFAGKSSRDVVGYVMPKVAGQALCSFGEPRWRREHAIAGDDVVAMLLALHDAIAGLHRAGVVIGDCNDLNVLVEARRVHLIDVDSYQLPGFPCSMFSERFVDPRLCNGGVVPQRPHDADSDWFAFAAMVLRTLLGVGPWGGVHASCLATQRASRRLSVLGSGITYPRSARPIATLPDELVDVLRAVFERDVRGTFARALLERLRLRACATCGESHARSTCPACKSVVHNSIAHNVSPVVVHGRLRWSMLPAPPPPQTIAVGPATRPCWLADGAIWRMRSSDAERIGSVLAGQTRAWVGAKLGVGFYRVGGFAAGFVFRPDRGALDDRVALPALRGQLVDARATIGDDRAWLWLTLAARGRLTTTAIVVGADAKLVAAHELGDAETAWLGGAAGACAAGPHLFVPTDVGIARIEVIAGALVQTRVFAETADIVSSGDRLVLADGGIAVARSRDSLFLQLT
ncbi:MAG TPA: hypothetical protein VH143_22150 [Kofleriaceae bacterium]|nr:hypothetical protein [Kofleriaceae bacterium]